MKGTLSISQLPHFIKSNKDIQNGMIFLPDISGYTNLVHTTDVITGSSITFELLSSILDQNTLGLKVAEVEGDAIFFYKYGQPPTKCTILNQYESMLEAFHERLEVIQKRAGLQLPLSLKLIAHYGPLAEFKIGNFKKLYGEVVIEAHRLLKNSIVGHTYALITDDLMNAAAPMQGEKPPKNGTKVHTFFEIYGGLRKICYTYYDFESVKHRLTA